MEWLAELSWWVPAGMAILAVSLWGIGNNRLDRKFALAGAVLLALAAALGLASFLLKSDRERAIASTRALVKAVVRRDAAAIGSLLDQRASVAGISGRDAVVAVAVASAAAADLQSAIITSLDGRNSDGQTTVTFRVLAMFKDGSQLTDWRLTWVRAPQGIVMRRADFLGGPGMGDAKLERYLKEARPR